MLHKQVAAYACAAHETARAVELLASLPRQRSWRRTSSARSASSSSSAEGNVAGTYRSERDDFLFQQAFLQARAELLQLLGASWGMCQVRKGLLCTTAACRSFWCCASGIIIGMVVMVFCFLGVMLELCCIVLRCTRYFILLAQILKSQRVVKTACDTNVGTGNVDGTHMLRWGFRKGRRHFIWVELIYMGTIWASYCTAVRGCIIVIFFVVFYRYRTR